MSETRTAESGFNAFKKLAELEKKLADTKERENLQKNPEARLAFSREYEAARNQIAAELQRLSRHHFIQFQHFGYTGKKNDETGKPKEEAKLYLDTKQVLTDSFNKLSGFVISDILEKANITERTLAIERWISLIHKMVELEDYHSAYAIKAAIQNSSVYRLNATNEGLSSTAKEFMKRVNFAFGSHPTEGYNLAQAADPNHSLPYLGNHMTIRESFLEAKNHKKVIEMGDAIELRIVKQKALDQADPYRVENGMSHFQQLIQNQKIGDEEEERLYALSCMREPRDPIEPIPSSNVFSKAELIDLIMPSSDLPQASNQALQEKYQQAELKYQQEILKEEKRKLENIKEELLKYLKKEENLPEEGTQFKRNKHLADVLNILNANNSTRDKKENLNDIISKAYRKEEPYAVLLKHSGIGNIGGKTTAMRYLEDIQKQLNRMVSLEEEIQKLSSQAPQAFAQAKTRSQTTVLAKSDAAPSKKRRATTILGKLSKIGSSKIEPLAKKKPAATTQAPAEEDVTTLKGDGIDQEESISSLIGDAVEEVPRWQHTKAEKGQLKYKSETQNVDWDKKIKEIDVAYQAAKKSVAQAKQELDAAKKSPRLSQQISIKEDLYQTALKILDMKSAQWLNLARQYQRTPAKGKFDQERKQALRIVLENYDRGATPLDKFRVINDAILDRQSILHRHHYFTNKDGEDTTIIRLLKATREISVQPLLNEWRTSDKHGGYQASFNKLDDYIQKLKADPKTSKHKKRELDDFLYTLITKEGKDIPEFIAAQKAKLKTHPATENDSELHRLLEQLHSFSARRYLVITDTQHTEARSAPEHRHSAPPLPTQQATVPMSRAHSMPAGGASDPRKIVPPRNNTLKLMGTLNRQGAQVQPKPIQASPVDNEAPPPWKRAELPKTERKVQVEPPQHNEAPEWTKATPSQQLAKRTVEIVAREEEKTPNEETENNQEGPKPSL